MTKTFLILFLTLALTSSQQYLPKQPGFLPINDLYARDIAREGWTTFWKVDATNWGVLVSSLPVRPNALTRVTVYQEVGTMFHFGCGKKDAAINDILDWGDICRMNGIVTYLNNGNKCKWSKYDSRAEQTTYDASFVQGDNVTMQIDMRPYRGSVSFSKNGQPMRIAFSELNEWGDIYIYMTLYHTGSRIRIVDYSVVE